MISTLTSLIHISSSPDRVRARADLQKKDTVGETRQGINLAITIREAGIRAPLAHDCGCQTDSKTSTVEEHMYAVGEQPERAADEAVEELDHHEAEVENSKIRNAS